MILFLDKNNEYKIYKIIHFQFTNLFFCCLFVLRKCILKTPNLKLPFLNKQRGLTIQILS